MGPCAIVRVAARRGGKSPTVVDADAAARPRLTTLAALSIVLVGWNGLINFGPVGDVAYVLANLALAVTLLAVARRWGLPWSSLGLSRAALARGAATGLVAAAVVGLAVLAAWTLPVTRPLLADQRVAGLSGTEVAYWALVRIPLGTALAEELVFRSALLGAFASRLGWRGGAAASSVVFGLWHIAPSAVALRVNELVVGPWWMAVGVATAVVVTFVAGLALCGLRWWGAHVIAPTLAHAATNVFALLAAVAVAPAP